MSIALLIPRAAFILRLDKGVKVVTNFLPTPQYLEKLQRKPQSRNLSVDPLSFTAIFMTHWNGVSGYHSVQQCKISGSQGMLKFSHMVVVAAVQVAVLVSEVARV